MKILIAPDSFKGTYSAYEAASFMALGAREACLSAEISLLPLSDGGEGAAEVLIGALDGHYEEHSVSGPRGGKIYAKDLCFDGGAFIETASASGLMLLGEGERDPLYTTSLGTGEQIALAAKRLSQNAGRAADEEKTLLIGLGGSATTDGGVGIAYALGWKFFDKNGEEFLPVGGTLSFIERAEAPMIDILKDIKVIGICDVDNPLLGDNGAANVFAPQKGADIRAVELLEEGMKELSRKVLEPISAGVSNMNGAGAAGGIGAGIIAFLSGELMSGAEAISSLCGLDEKINGADLVITGEGKTDSQTERGKLPFYVARRAAELGKTAVVVSGTAEGALPAFERLGVKVYSASHLAGYKGEMPEDTDKALINCAKHAVLQFVQQRK